MVGYQLLQILFGSLIAIPALGQAATATPFFLEQDNTPLKVKNFFTTSCYGCHGAKGHPPVAGLDVLNLKYLFSSGLVVAGSSQFSELYSKVAKGEMPPPGENFPNGQTPPAPTQEDIDLLKNWIDGGAASWDDGSANQDITRYEAVLRSIVKDLGSLDSTKAL